MCCAMRCGGIASVGEKWAVVVSMHVFDLPRRKKEQRPLLPRRRLNEAIVSE